MDLLQIDIYENEIFERSPELLSMLLIDRSQYFLGDKQLCQFWGWVSI